MPVPRQVGHVCTAPYKKVYERIQQFYKHEPADNNPNYIIHSDPLELEFNDGNSFS